MKALKIAAITVSLLVVAGVAIDYAVRMQWIPEQAGRILMMGLLFGAIAYPAQKFRQWASRVEFTRYGIRMRPPK